MFNCDNLFGAQDQLQAAECATTVLHPLNDSVEALELFPDEIAYACIVRYALVTTATLD